MWKAVMWQRVFTGEKVIAEFAFLGDTDLPEYSIHPVSLRLSGFRRALKEAQIKLFFGWSLIARVLSKQWRI